MIILFPSSKHIKSSKLDRDTDKKIIRARDRSTNSWMT